MATLRVQRAAPPPVLPLVLPPRWRELLTYCHTADSTDGPPRVPSAALVAAVRELRPLAVFAVGFLPGDVDVDGLPCELLRVDGPALATVDRRLSDARATPGVGTPTVLAVNVGASALGRLRHRLALGRNPATLVALGAQKVPGPGLPSDVDVGASAQAEWGHHVISDAQSLVTMGAPLVGSHAAAGRVQLMALQFHCSSHPYQGVQPPATTLLRLTDSPQPLPTLHIVADPDANREVLGVLRPFHDDVTASSLDLQWHTTWHQPGREAHHHAGELDGLIHHVLRLSHPARPFDVPREPLQSLRQAIRALPASTIPITTWEDSDLDDAVHIPLARGAIVRAFATAGPLAAVTGGSVGLSATGLHVMHLQDMLFQPFLDQLRDGAPGCLRDCSDSAALCPRRISLLPCASTDALPDTECSQLRFLNPHDGHHLLWLVHTNGQATPTQVHAAVAAVVGSQSIAHVSDCSARDPDRGGYCAMVRIRVHPGAARAMDAAFLGTGSLRGLGPRPVRIFHCTHVRDPLRSPPPSPRLAGTGRCGAGARRGARTAFRRAPSGCCHHPTWSRPPTV